MLIARWQIDARFGHKQTVIDMMRQWERDIGRKVGTDQMEFELLTGSVGAREATVETDHKVASLADLEAFFTKIGQMEEHRKWGKDLEPYVVSGSSFWSIYRLLE